jgi:hypothetical protein
MTATPKTAMRCAPCSSSDVLPMMPRWLDRAIAMGVVGIALTAVVAAATGAFV